ncbi:TonB-dependent receptor [Croceicoccus sediminis]|uniref:TonB-dependent receptor n=1 Tax=Croceicoccus sediminis TaxID=2571150 RepID=UPI0014798173|nr:TonB-dependent receptor [Croceicoccus sediminis]
MAQAVSLNGSDENGQGEIIVTARKKSERLLDVPVAITALDGEALAEKGISDLSAVGTLLPQVRFETVGGGGNGATFAIRGIGSASGDKGIEQTVAVNIDGVQSSRGRISVLSFFDVEQVEVLKGPQALYFGKNSPGGVISVKTAGPGDVVEGYARAGYEFNADERFIEAAVGGPISDAFGVRVAARASKTDGWIKNVAQPIDSPFDPGVILRPSADKLPSSRQYLGRITLALTPSENFDASLKIFAADVKQNNELGPMETVCTGEHASSYGVIDPFSDCKLDGRTSNGALPSAYAGDGWPGSRDGTPYNDTKAYLSSLTMNYYGENFTITSVTGAYKLDSKGFDNYDGTIYARLTGYTFEDTKALSQELRVSTDFESSVNATVGAFFETQKRSSGGVGGAGLNSADSNGFYALWDRTEEARGKTYSAFGQIDWEITDALELSGGVRYTKETKKGAVTNDYVNQDQMLGPNFPASAILLPEGVTLRPKRTDDNWSPEVSLTYKPNTDLMIYAAYRTGFKSGGISATSVLGATSTAENLVFRPEKAKGGEVGMKAQLLNRKLTLIGAIYRYTFTDLQQATFNAGPPATFSINNAGRSRTTGVELEGNFRATSDLTLSGAVAYNDGKYLEFLGAPCYAGQTAQLGCVGGQQDLSGAQLPYNPKWSANAGFQLDKPVSDTMMVGFSGRATYNGKVWANTTNNPLARQDDYIRLDGGLKLYPDGKRWELALIGRNLTNERYAVYATDKPGGPASGGEILAVTNRPREVMLQGTVRF